MIDTKDSGVGGCRNLLDVPHSTINGENVEMDDQPEKFEENNFLGPHNWRKKLKPVQSPIHKEHRNGTGEGASSR